MATYPIRGGQIRRSNLEVIASPSVMVGQEQGYKRRNQRAAAFRQTMQRFVGDLLRAQHDKRKAGTPAVEYFVL